MTRPTDPRGASRPQYTIVTYYDDDSGWCAEITDTIGDFVGIAIAHNERNAQRKAQDMIKEANRE